jgi:prepilin-type processing-associated H-X9-DG protein
MQFVYPEYLNDHRVLACPSDPSPLEESALRIGGDEQAPVDPCAFASASYLYLPWTLDETYYVLPGRNSGEMPQRVGVTFSPGALTAVGGAIGGWAAHVATGGAAGNPKALDQHLQIDYDMNGTPEKTAYRLAEGVERFLVTDINNAAGSVRAESGIAVMWDILDVQVKDFSHVPGGCNVLYLDGHVTFEKYSGRHPVNRAFAALVGLWAKQAP